MGFFGGLHNTWSDGYQIGDFTKSLLYDLNPIAWAGDALANLGNKDFDFFNNNPNWTPSAEDPIDQGIINTWNKYTGNAHLTPENQHAEEREDSVNQRTAEDMTLAGLSKYGFGGTAVGTSNASNGLTLLDAIGKAQQISAGALEMKERAYNLKTSKRLGIRTSDKNSLGQLTSLAKALFGLDLSDIPDEGIIPALFNAFKESFGNGSLTGSVADFGGAMASTGGSASTPADVVKAAEKVLDEQEINEAIGKGLQDAGLDITPPSLESHPKDFGIDDSFARSAESFIGILKRDGKDTSENIDLLAYQLAKRYNLSKDDVLEYLYGLLK